MRGKSLENLNRDATFEDSEYCVGEKMKKKIVLGGGRSKK